MTKSDISIMVHEMVHRETEMLLCESIRLTGREIILNSKTIWWCMLTNLVYIPVDEAVWISVRRPLQWSLTIRIEK